MTLFTCKFTKKEEENLCLVFMSSTKCEIRKFDVDGNEMDQRA